MSGPPRLGNGRLDEPSEHTPLLPPPPSTADAPSEALLNDHSNGTIKGHERTSPPSEGGAAAAKPSITLSRAIICTIALGSIVFLQASNISMLTTTGSDIAEELDAFERATWFTSAYLIAMSALGPLNGKLAAIFGPRPCIFAATIVLSSGCLVSSIAHSFEVFVIGRCITGIGASGIFTISIIVVLELTSPQRRGLAIGLLNTGYTIGVAVGATAAGALVPHVGWRAIFWMQAPIAVTGGTVLFLALPSNLAATKAKTTEQTTTKRLLRLDYFGALTLTGSIVLLLGALSAHKKIPLLPIGLSAIVMATFILNELHFASDPIIPVALLKSRGLLLTCLGTVGYMMARWCVLFYAPIFAQAVRVWNPATAGAILIPTNGGFAIGGLAVGWLHIRRQGSFWLPTIVVYSLFPFTLVLLAFLSTQTSPPALYILIVFACGAVTGAALNYNVAHLLHLTPKETHYIAMALMATFRGFAGSFGSAIGGGLFTRTLSGALEAGFERQDMHDREDLVRRLLGSPKLVKVLEGAEQDVAIRGYEVALKRLFLAGAGLAALTVFVQAGTGWKAPGQGPAKPNSDRDGRDERDEREARS